MGVYIVQEGDNLSKIGKNLVGDTEFWRSDAFKAANPGIDANRLSIGQKLEIPGFETPQAEGIPEPRPRPNITKVATPPERPIGSLPAAEEEEPYVSLDEFLSGMSARMGGPPEEAIPEEPSLAQTLRDRGMSNVTETIALPTQPPGGAPPGFLTPDPRKRPDSGGLLTRGVTRPTEEAGPDFSMASNPAQALPEDAGQGTDIGVNFANADPGAELTLTPEQMARFQPEQADKVNEVLRMFFREPNLIDDVLQSIGVTSAAAQQ
jgi:hypothetical protein